MFETFLGNPDLRRTIAAAVARIDERSNAKISGTEFWFAYRLISKTRKRPPPFELRCLDPATKAVFSGGSMFRPNAEGEGLSFWRREAGTLPTSVVLELRWEEESEFRNVGAMHLETTARRFFNIANDLSLEVTTVLSDSAIENEAGTRTGRGKRFPVAIVGSSAQISLLLPMLRGSCLDVRRLFVNDTDAALPNAKGTETLGLTDLSEETITDLFAILDFSGDERGARLKETYRRPGAERGPIILDGLERLLANPRRLRESVREVLDGIPHGETRRDME